MTNPHDLDLTGFDVEARDEPVGRVHTATNEVDESFIVVDAALQRVLLPAGLITEVDSDRRRITLSCTAAQVRGAPKYDEQQRRVEQEVVDDTAVEEPAEPTKEELYAEAGRLGVPGRSTMTKDELGDELERLQTEKATPIQVQTFLDGVQYPLDKGDLLKEVQKQRAGADVLATIERLPDRRFEDPTDVSRAIGELP
jgi:uncharacterized protein DUF2795